MVTDQCNVDTVLQEGVHGPNEAGRSGNKATQRGRPMQETSRSLHTCLCSGAVSGPCIVSVAGTLRRKASRSIRHTTALWCCSAKESPTKKSVRWPPRGASTSCASGAVQKSAEYRRNGALLAQLNRTLFGSHRGQRQLPKSSPRLDGSHTPLSNAFATQERGGAGGGGGAGGALAALIIDERWHQEMQSICMPSCARRVE